MLRFGWKKVGEVRKKFRLGRRQLEETEREREKDRQTEREREREQEGVIP